MSQPGWPAERPAIHHAHVSALFSRRERRQAGHLVHDSGARRAEVAHLGLVAVTNGGLLSEVTQLGILGTGP